MPDIAHPNPTLTLASQASVEAVEPLEEGVTNPEPGSEVLLLKIAVVND